MNRKDKIKTLKAEINRLNQEEKAEKTRNAQARKEAIKEANSESWEWRLIRGSSPDIARRDVGMLRDWCAGMTHREIGKQHGISAARVRQIIYKVIRCLYRIELAVSVHSSTPLAEAKAIWAEALVKAERGGI